MREFKQMRILDTRRWPIVVALILAPVSATIRAEQPVLRIGVHKQLLVDDHIVSSKRGVQRRIGKVTKASGGKPIFRDGWFYGTVLHDEGRFKLWFRRPENKGYGYAESEDGMRFDAKATLTGIDFAGDINLAVERNRPDADQQRRFIAGFDAPGMAAGLAHSADGIHWRMDNDGKPVTFRAADCHNQVLWDHLAETYRLFTRTDFGSGGGPLARTAAPDFEVRGTRAMINPDIEADPANWTIIHQWWLNREGPKEYLRRQLYSMTVWIHEGVYFALMSIYEYPSDVSEGHDNDYVRRHERDVMDFYLATSRDCDHWDLTWVYAAQPLVPRGPDGAFDKDIVFPSSTIVTHDDRHWIYYGGANERHGTEEIKPPVRFRRHTGIGLATLPLDRFVSLSAGQPTGEVVTRPFTLEGDSLSVNISAPRGAFRVEILDPAGTPIDGYAGANAQRYAAIDELRLEPQWRKTLASLRGQPIRLRFLLDNADLYAFEVGAKD